MTSRQRTVIKTLFVAAASSCVLATLIQFVAVRLVDGMTVEQAKSINDARVSLIQLVGGIGLVGGLIYTARTFALTRFTQRADRFTKAVEQIGDESEAVRAGGVHSMWRLTTEDENYWPAVLNVLTALVRQRAKRGTVVNTDVQAALTLIGDRPVTAAARRPLDLRGVHLPGALLMGANLSGAWLDGSNLAGADLTDARLGRARLISANLDDADLSAADFSEADLKKAKLRRANFYKTVLYSADIAGSSLQGARHLTDEQLRTTYGEPSGAEPT